MDIYKEGVRRNLRFKSNTGELTVYQLFGAGEDTLAMLENNLADEVESSKKVNRFQKSTNKDFIPKLKLSIVSDVIDTLIEEREEQLNASDKKEARQKLLAEKARRADANIETISDAELDKQIAENS